MRSRSCPKRITVVLAHCSSKPAEISWTSSCTRGRNWIGVPGTRACLAAQSLPELKAMEAAPLATRLTTYLELEQIVQAFARGHLNLLILIGGHGLGKSRIVRQALDGQVCWLEGNLSVFGL